MIKSLSVARKSTISRTSISTFPAASTCKRKLYTTNQARRPPVQITGSRRACFLALYYFRIHLRHLLAPFPLWRPLIPLSVALLRCVSFALASAKNSLRILAHSHLEIVLGSHSGFFRGGAQLFSGKRRFFPRKGVDKTREKTYNMRWSNLRW